MEKYYYKSLIGILEIVVENNELISLKLVDKIRVSCKETIFIKNIISQLEGYFCGERKEFNIKINPKGTKLQRLVWQELNKIPYGKTKSYSEIAESMGNKNFQRAIGSACNKNPIMIIIPCHRVISKSGNLGGFAYGTQIKQQLLGLEDFFNN